MHPTTAEQKMREMEAMLKELDAIDQALTPEQWIFRARIASEIITNRNEIISDLRGEIKRLTAENSMLRKPVTP